jgi:hypothetical protein
MAITENIMLIRQALAYVIELYHELTEENGAPTLGTQNQVVDFILADPELSRAVSDWRRTSRSMRPRPTRLRVCQATAPISASAPICNR